MQGHADLLLFQSLSRDSGRLNYTVTVQFTAAFFVFQSLSRDSGRLNNPIRGAAAVVLRVSIPQSGFGAFEPNRRDDSSAIFSDCFNPSVGIRGV